MPDTFTVQLCPEGERPQLQGSFATLEEARAKLKDSDGSIWARPAGSDLGSGRVVFEQLNGKVILEIA